MNQAKLSSFRIASTNFVLKNGNYGSQCFLLYSHQQPQRMLVQQQTRLFEPMHTSTCSHKQ